MSRPEHNRKISALPAATHFKPQGIPTSQLEVVELQVDEYEALRLADGEGLYHSDAAKQMGVSRQTFGRILQSARSKIADTLTHGKLLRILGGKVEFQTSMRMQCRACDHDWQLEQLQSDEMHCPNCDSSTIGSMNPAQSK